jgi:hypothetical protein
VASESKKKLALTYLDPFIITSSREQDSIRLFLKTELSTACLLAKQVCEMAKHNGVGLLPIVCFCGW